MKTFNREQRVMLLRIFLAAVTFILALAAPPFFHPAVLYLLPYGIIGWDVLWGALRNILRGKVFDENFLMALATVGV